MKNDVHGLWYLSSFGCHICRRDVFRITIKTVQALAERYENVRSASPNMFTTEAKKDDS